MSLPKQQRLIDHCANPDGRPLRTQTSDVSGTEVADRRLIFIPCTCCCQADEHFDGLLDILVNNVGTSIRKASLDYTREEYASIMDTNFSSLFLLTLVRRGPRADEDLALCVSRTDVRLWIAAADGRESESPLHTSGR